ncbi:glycosyltransferase family 2 protein [filamentous cyanobacterium LEGE 11480]|uniref:Glycosyltransferase family 2 protein n=1 Tax=Romeriopsis navalis LEGE 11480 TaxID=2777977 RepID=A0A928VN30_9CYAN|nr:glycosyltransferase family 2 protein [Romeriopsis navalis]MBE9030713.1 glycosyltransferase family 2 protein [Romeriopsis navalis LEGE 11480]
MSFKSAAALSLVDRLPQVSVIVPVYNAESFLAATIHSILQQTYKDFEIIAVDDGSTDRSAAILTDLAQTDSRLRVIQQPHQGVAIARNTAIAAARGTLVAPIDADDLWHPEFLAAHIHRHNQTPRITVSYCWSLDIDHQNQWSGGFQAAPIQGWVHNTMLCHYFLGNGSCSLIKRSALLAIDGYRSQFAPYSLAPPGMGQAVCEDWDLYLRLAEQYQFGVVSQFLVGYRKHPLSASQQVQRMAYWHEQLLTDRQQRLPAIRPWVFHLSDRSFRSYLKQQAQPSLPGKGPPQKFPTALPATAWGRIQCKLLISQILHQLIQTFGQNRSHCPPMPPPSSTAQSRQSDAPPSTLTRH